MRMLARIALLTALLAPGLLALSFLAPSFLAPSVAFAVTPDEVLKDPALEARARDLSRELRCMVCQNQSIDDSEAPLAKDLRVLVRERLTQGDSDKQVLNFLVARYGEFVLLKPPFEWHTLVLWGAMPVALVAGMVGLIMIARRRTSPVPASMALSADERRRIEALLKPGSE